MLTTSCINSKINLLKNQSSSSFPLIPFNPQKSLHKLSIMLLMYLLKILLLLNILATDSFGFLTLRSRMRLSTRKNMPFSLSCDDILPLTSAVTPSVHFVLYHVGYHNSMTTKHVAAREERKKINFSQH